MTLNNMNNLKFTPRKDYTANRLVSGVLQLSDGTQLILNETALQPGQLDANGDFFKFWFIQTFLLCGSRKFDLLVTSVSYVYEFY